MQWGAWQPDKAGPNAGVCTTCEGVYPISANKGIGYAPFPSLSVPAGAAALAAAPRGALNVQKPDGNWSFFAATSSNLYQMQSDYSFTSIDSGMAVPPGDDMSMVLFGSKLIYTNTTDGMQAYDVSTSTAEGAVAGAPAARALVVINNVLFALGTVTNPDIMQSSDIGQYNVWTGGASDGKEFEDGGALIGGADLKNGNGVIFQERAIRLVSFSDGATTYTLQKLSDGIGCLAERTIIAHDGKVAWWDDDGPYMMEAGGAPVPIGAEKINRWLNTYVTPANYENMQGQVDPDHKLFLWRVDGSQILAYSYLINEWTVLPASTTWLSRIATPAQTIDALTGTIDNLTGTINGLGGGNAPQLAALNSSLKFSTFTGTNMAATLQTCAYADAATQRFRMASPEDDCSSGTLEIGVADRLADSLAWKSGVTLSASGRAHLRARGKVFAFRRNIPAAATWSYSTGIENIVTTPSGPRS